MYFERRIRNARGVFGLPALPIMIAMVGGMLVVLIETANLARVTSTLILLGVLVVGFSLVLFRLQVVIVRQLRRWHAEDEIERAKERANYAQKPDDYGEAAAAYLEVFLKYHLAEGNSMMEWLDFRHMKPGLKYLALRVQEVAKENVRWQQGELDDSNESGEDGALQALGERSKLARDAFWRVKNGLFKISHAERRWLGHIQSWRDALNLE